MAALKYILILSVCLYSIQLAKGKVTIDPDAPDEDYVAPENVEINEAELKKKAKETLSDYMSNKVVQGTVDTFRDTAEIILTNPISSDAIITLMRIIRTAMTNSQSLVTVQYIQKLINNILNEPLQVKTFFDNLTEWFKDPQSLENVKTKDELIERCIHLTVASNGIDTLTKAIRQMNFENLPESIDAMFGNFHYLVEFNPNLRVQDVLSAGASKTAKGFKRLIPWKNNSSNIPISK